MAEIIKIVVVALVCAVTVSLVKQYAPSYSSIAQIAALIAVLGLGMSFLKKALSQAAELMDISIIESGYALLLFKALGVAVAAKLACDVCRDSGSSSLASAVELVAKGAILVMTMPMLKALAGVVSGLLGG